MDTKIRTTHKLAVLAGAVALAVTVAAPGMSQAQSFQRFGGDAASEGAYRSGVTAGATDEASADQTTVATPDALGDQTVHGSYRDGGPAMAQPEKAAPTPDTLGDVTQKGGYRD